MKRLVVFPMLVMASLAFAPAAIATQGAPSRFVGNWTSVDCATWWQPLEDGSMLVDCDVWGDGSLQTLHIGHGDAPRVTSQDSFASICANAGSPSTHWVGVGTGEYASDEFGQTLWVHLTKTGCGNYVSDDDVVFPLFWCCEDGSVDNLFSDPDGDGWGTLWTRAN